jgi:FkbM family methyltransferase
VVELVDKIHKLLDNNPHLKKRVDVEAAFLGCIGGTADMKLPKSVDASWNLFDSERRNPVTGATALPLSLTSVETLDTFVAKKGLARLDLIKIDVDGYELDVLRGGESSIKSFRPVIVMEWCPQLSDARGSSLEHLREFWHDTRYVAYRLRWKRPPIPISWDDLSGIEGVSHVDLILKPEVFSAST